MIGLPAAVRVYLYSAPCDRRRGFDGLKALAEHGVGVDPLGGDLFVFCGRRGDRVKILDWDRDGWAAVVEAAGSRHVCVSVRRLRAETDRRGRAGRAAGGVGSGERKTAKTLCAAVAAECWKPLRTLGWNVFVPWFSRKQNVYFL